MILLLEYWRKLAHGILVVDPWFLNIGKLVWILKGTVNYDSYFGSILYHSLQLWNEQGLGYTASVVGKPLHADDMTESWKRLSYLGFVLKLGSKISYLNLLMFTLLMGLVCWSLSSINASHCLVLQGFWYGCIQDAENQRVPTQGLARRFGCHKVEMFYLRILEMLQSLRQSNVLTRVLRLMGPLLMARKFFNPWLKPNAESYLAQYGGTYGKRLLLIQWVLRLCLNHWMKLGGYLGGL